MKIRLLPLLLLLAALPSLPAAEPADYLRDFARDAAVRWPKNRTLAIVAHGHSVPAGYMRAGLVRTVDAYPRLLHVALGDRYPYAVINVIVTAIGGEHAEKGAARFARDVLPLQPDVLLIDYSLNDRSIGLDCAELAWRSMIEQALAAHIKVILLTPTLDTKADLADPSDQLNQHAALVRRLAAEYDVALVDSLAACGAAVNSGRDPARLMSQNNHPNRAGHELVARQLLDWFPAPPPPPSSVPVAPSASK